MTSMGKALFNSLILKVEETFKSIYPEIKAPISEWKGEEINTLRNSLYDKTGSSISEKWFYTHVKGNQEQLPRKDTLNILSNYCGYKSWDHFVYSEEDNSNENDPHNRNHSGLKRTKNVIIPIIAMAIVITISLLISVPFFKDPTYRFCFIDKNTRVAVMDTLIEVKVYKKNESPKSITIRKTCFSGKGEEVSFVAKSKYYKPIKVDRTITKDEYHEEIALNPDDYAMMIHLLSHSKTEDWNRRRKQLNEIIHDQIKAYQVNDKGFGMEVYNKKEFINKLTLPTKGLKNLEILETEYLEDKIFRIRFMQND